MCFNIAGTVDPARLSLEDKRVRFDGFVVCWSYGLAYRVDSEDTLVWLISDFISILVLVLYANLCCLGNYEKTCRIEGLKL
jgi:hypothetical protein